MLLPHGQKRVSLKACQGHSPALSLQTLYVNLTADVKEETVRLRPVHHQLSVPSRPSDLNHTNRSYFNSYSAKLGYFLRPVPKKSMPKQPFGKHYRLFPHPHRSALPRSEKDAAAMSSLSNRQSVADSTSTPQLHPR